jgi:hypothetical protein
MYIHSLINKEFRSRSNLGICSGALVHPMLQPDPRGSKKITNMQWQLSVGNHSSDKSRHLLFGWGKLERYEIVDGMKWSNFMLCATYNREQFLLFRCYIYINPYRFFVGGDVCFLSQRIKMSTKYLLNVPNDVLESKERLRETSNYFRKKSTAPCLNFFELIFGQSGTRLASTFECCKDTWKRDNFDHPTVRHSNFHFYAWCIGKQKSSKSKQHKSCLTFLKKWMPAITNYICFQLGCSLGKQVAQISNYALP